LIPIKKCHFPILGLPAPFGPTKPVISQNVTINFMATARDPPI